MIKLKDLVNEAKGNVTVFDFNQVRDFEKAEGVLYKAGWYENGSGNPPSIEQLKKGMIFDTDQYRYEIEVGSDREDKVRKMFDRNGIKYKLRNRQPSGDSSYWAGGQYT